MRCVQRGIFLHKMLKGPLWAVLSQHGNGHMHVHRGSLCLYIGEMTPVLALKTPRGAQNIDVASLQRELIMPSNGLG